MTDLKIRVNNSNFIDLVKGLELEFNDIAKTINVDKEVTSDQLLSLSIWVIYSCLNGPVGKGKTIEVGGTTISGRDLSFISGSQIRRLCTTLKPSIPRGMSCIMVEKYGDYYPNERFDSEHP